jgi:arginine utilization protein RocB
VRCTDYFAGISDMSFLGEADETDLAIVARNTPMWKDGVRWPEKGGIADIPTINIGPWGRDYHTPLERLHTGYAFDVLPRILGDLVKMLLD